MLSYIRPRTGLYSLFSGFQRK